MPKNKVRLSVDVPVSLRNELKVYSSLTQVAIQAVVIREIMSCLRLAAEDKTTLYSAVANRNTLGLVMPKPVTELTDRSAVQHQMERSL